jgi:hypothetical protein
MFSGSTENVAPANFDCELHFHNHVNLLFLYATIFLWPNRITVPSPSLPLTAYWCCCTEFHYDKTYAHIKQTPRPSSTSELYRPSDRRLSAKLVPTLADRGCCVVTAVNFGFPDQSRYFSIQAAPQKKTGRYFTYAQLCFLNCKTSTIVNKAIVTYFNVYGGH